MQNNIRVSISFFLLIISTIIFASGGSDVISSVEPFTTFFQNNNATNAIKYLANMQNGFSLENSDTICTYRSLGHVAGPIHNNGTIELQSDFVLHAKGRFEVLGTFKCNGYSITLSKNAESLPDNQLIIEDGILVLSNNTEVKNTILCKGNCTILGSNYTLQLLENAKIIVDSDATLTIEKVALKGLKDVNVHCVDNTAKINFVDVSLHLQDDFIFDTGCFDVSKKVVITGGHSFLYESDLASTIFPHSQLSLKGKVNFKVGRFDAETDVEPLIFIDRTSQLVVNNCTFTSTAHGINLRRGELFVAGIVNVVIEGESPEKGIMYGNGIDPEEDIFMTISGNGFVQLSSGFTVNNNVTPNAIQALSRDARILRKAGSSMIINNDIIFPALTLEIEADVTSPPLQLAPDKTIRYTGARVVLPITSFNFIGVQDGIGSYYMNTGSLLIEKGFLPMNLFVSGGYNSIAGTGSMAGTIQFEDLYTWIVWALSGEMKNDIALNGGTIILQSDLCFTSGEIISGGTIKLGKHRLIFDAEQLECDQNLLLNGEKGTVQLTSDLTLNSSWTIAGTVVIDGRGRELALGDFGEIIVTPGSTVLFKNIILTNVSGNAIYCFDDTGSVVFSQSTVVLSDDFTFNTGKIEIMENVQFAGEHAFIYGSSQSSMIKDNATLQLTKGVKFQIGRFDDTTTTEPLLFADQTSVLNLDDCSFIINENGINFQKGTLLCSGEIHVTLENQDIAKGISLGDGLDSNNDSFIKIKGGSLVTLNNGALVYNNISSHTVTALSRGVRIVRGSGSTIVVNQDAVFPPMALELEVDFVPPIIVSPGKIITYEDAEIILPFSQYHLSGNQIGTNGYILNGNDNLFLTKGSVPLQLFVENGGNLINGNGSILGTITFADEDTWMVWAVNGSMKNNIELNGGSIILESSLKFTEGKFVTDGTVKLQENILTFAPNQTLFEENILFDGNKGGIKMISDTELNGTWTISGEVIIDGNGFGLRFGDNGKIIVAPNSCLHLKNISLLDIQNCSLGCIDNSGLLLLDNVSWNQIENINFEKGAIIVLNSVKCYGDNNILRYKSIQPLQINAKSKCKINKGITLDYAPENQADDLLLFVDKTAELILQDGKMQVTNTDLVLSKGTLTISGNSEIVIDDDANIISFGTGLEDQDLHIVIDIGSSLLCSNGIFAYKNNDESSFITKNEFSQLIINKNTTLQLFKTINLGVGSLALKDAVTLAIALEEDVIGAVIPNGVFTRTTVA